MAIVGYLDNLAQALAIADWISITMQLTNADGFTLCQSRHQRIGSIVD